MTNVSVDIIKSIRNLNKFERCLWVGSAFMVSASFLLAGSGDYLTLMASLVGVTALIFIAKGDVLGQVLTVVFSIMYSIISFFFAYYGEMITYMGMTAPIAAMSVITWSKNPYDEKQVKVKSLKMRHFILLGLITAIVTWIFYYILMYFHTTNLFFSTISVATSFCAATLMMLRNPYYAVAYAANDIVLIVLWVMATMENLSYMPMILCFVMFLINDIYGFINWRRMRELQKNLVNEI